MVPEDAKVENTPDEDNGRNIRLACSSCKNRTNHKVLNSVTHDWRSEEIGIQGTDKMLIVECAGCESVHFCKISSNSEDFEEEKDDQGRIQFIFTERIDQFPKIDLDLFKRPQFFNSIPKSVKDTYEETYRALQNDMPKLAAAGARLIVEVVCLAHKIKDGSLEQKIDQLKKDGHITQSMKIMLHNVRLFGNRHLHTTRSPDFFDLAAAWDAVNNLLIAIYGIADSNRQFEFQSEIRNKPDISAGLEK